MSVQAVNLTNCLANAGYAMGTVFAVQFALRLAQQRMFFVHGVLLAVGSFDLDCVGRADRGARSRREPGVRSTPLVSLDGRTLHRADQQR